MANVCSLFSIKHTISLTSGNLTKWRIYSHTHLSIAINHDEVIRYRYKNRLRIMYLWKLCFYKFTNFTTWNCFRIKIYDKMTVKIYKSIGIIKFLVR